MQAPRCQPANKSVFSVKTCMEARGRGFLPWLAGHPRSVCTHSTHSLFTSHWIIPKNSTHLQKIAFLTLRLRPLTKIPGFIFLPILMLCRILHVFGRGSKHGIHEAVSEGEASTRLKVSSLTLERYRCPEWRHTGPISRTACFSRLAQFTDKTEAHCC